MKPPPTLDQFGRRFSFAELLPVDLIDQTSPLVDDLLGEGQTMSHRHILAAPALQLR